MLLIVLFLCFLCSLCAWNQYGANTFGNFRSSFAGKSNSWRTGTNFTDDGNEMAVTSDGLLIMQASQNVFFLDAESGEILGESDISGVFGRLGWEEEYYAMVTNDDVKVVVMDVKKHGKDPWILSDIVPKYSTPQNIATTKNGMIILKINNLYGISYKEKKVVWEFPRWDDEDSEVLSIDLEGNIFLVNSSVNNLVKIDGETGKLLDHFTFTDQQYMDLESNIVFTEDALLFSYGSSSFVKIEQKPEMSVAWKINFGLRQCDNIALSNDYSYAYITCFKYLSPERYGYWYFITVDVSDGKIVNKVQLEGDPAWTGFNMFPGTIVTASGAPINVFVDTTYYFTKEGLIDKKEASPEGMKCGSRYAADANSLYRCCNHGYHDQEVCFKTKL